MLKRYLPLVALLILIWIVFPDMTFAQGTEQYGENKAEWFGNILQILSWAWVIPATVAGKLMTNDFVYGQVFGMTGILWKLRQAMRMFAYMTLGFIFIAMIIKHIIVQDEGSKMFDTLKKTAIAGILIAMTWWIMAVMVDISIVMTTAVGAIPLQTMGQQWNQLRPINVPIIEINGEDGIPDIIKSNQQEKTLTLEDVTPDADTVGGSLVFLGAGVMRLMNARFIEGPEATSKNYSALVVGGGLKIGIIVVFAVAMILLAIINVVRIFWIWIWILISPFLVIDILFNGPLQKGEHGESFKPVAIIGLVFQPVAIVGLLSLGLVMIIGILDSLLGGEEHKRESLEVLQVYIQADAGSQIGTGVNGETYIMGELFKDLGGSIGGFVGEIILALFAIFLLFALVKAAASFSSMTKGIVDTGFKFMKQGLMTVPLPGIGSLGSAAKGIQQVKNKVRSGQNQMANTQAETALAGIYKNLGLEQDDVNGGASPSDVRKAEDILGTGTPSDRTNKFFDLLHSWSKDPKKKKGISYRGDVKRLISDWFNEHGGKEQLEKNGLGSDLTLESDNVQQFIDSAIKSGNIDFIKISNGRTKLTDSTTWKNGESTN